MFYQFIETDGGYTEIGSDSDEMNEVVENCQLLWQGETKSLADARRKVKEENVFFGNCDFHIQEFKTKPKCHY